MMLSLKGHKKSPAEYSLAILSTDLETGAGQICKWGMCHQFCSGGWTYSSYNSLKICFLIHLKWWCIKIHNYYYLGFHRLY